MWLQVTSSAIYLCISRANSNMPLLINGRPVPAEDRCLRSYDQFYQVRIIILLVCLGSNHSEFFRFHKSLIADLSNTQITGKGTRCINLCSNCKWRWHANLRRVGLKPMQHMQLHWAPRHGVCAGYSFVPDTPCAYEFSKNGLQISLLPNS